MFRGGIDIDVDIDDDINYMHDIADNGIYEHGNIVNFIINVIVVVAIAIAIAVALTIAVAISVSIAIAIAVFVDDSMRRKTDGLLQNQ